MRPWVVTTASVSSRTLGVGGRIDRVGRQPVAGELGEIARHALQRGLGPVGDRDAGAVPEEPTRGGPADGPGTTGDERDAALETPHGPMLGGRCTFGLSDRPRSAGRPMVGRPRSLGPKRSG